MEPILTRKQLGLLLAAAVVALVIIDAHVVRTFVASKQYFEQQRKLHLRMLETVLKRETEINRDFFGKAEALSEPSTAQPVLFQMASRYGLVSAEILDAKGWLVAASQSGRPLMVPDDFPGMSEAQRSDLLEKGKIQHSHPLAVGEGVPQVAGLYLPFTAGDGTRFVLKGMAIDESLVRASAVSQEILKYQAMGIGAAVLLTVLAGAWILLPHRRRLRSSQVAATGSLDEGTRPRDENAAMVASFQGVIAKLREKERELMETSRADREKATTAARMSTDILQLMDAAVLLLSAQGRVIQGNRAASELFGMPPLVLYNQHYTTIFRGLDGWLEAVEAALQRGERVQDRELSRPGDGGGRVYRVSATPVSESGSRQGALCIINDVTERIHLERQLTEREKLVALGEMAGGLAHEVRNSLGTLVGLLRLLASSPTAGGEDQGEPERYQEMMQREIHELNRMVTEFLDFTRPLAIRLDSVDCSEILGRCVEELTVQFPERAADMHLAGELLPVQGDESLLRQAFLNLLRNGLESGQSVKVSVSGEIDPGTRTLRLDFRDTGCGIDPADIEKVFIPFYTTKEDGYGIGLALVKKIILAHSGRIEVESESGSGTVFHVYLPLAELSH